MSIMLPTSFSVHPRPWLKAEVLDHCGLSVKDAADRMDVADQTLSDMLNGEAALSSKMALRFEERFGLPAQTLLLMQARYDAHYLLRN